MTWGYRTFWRIYSPFWRIYSPFWVGYRPYWVDIGLIVGGGGYSLYWGDIVHSPPCCITVAYRRGPSCLSHPLATLVRLTCPPMSQTAFFHVTGGYNLCLTSKTPSRTPRQLFIRSASNPSMSDEPPTSHTHTHLFLCLMSPRPHSGPQNPHLHSLESNNGTSDVQHTSDVPMMYDVPFFVHLMCGVPLFYVTFPRVPHILLLYH